jgi:kinesin family protein 6/9
LENKDFLAKKKASYADLARSINCTKEELDKSLEKLRCMQQERQEEGDLMTDDGEVIISEDEYLEIQRVKDLKAIYRKSYDELKAIKNEVHYCQKLVDQCRQKLIKEFDSWYETNFLVGSTEAVAQLLVDDQRRRTTTGLTATGTTPDVSVAVPTATNVEDDQERFIRLQKTLLLKEPESAPFYKAQMRTQQRKLYEAATSQPSFGDNEGGCRRKVGTPTRAVRNQPPSMLQVQY